MKLFFSFLFSFGLFLFATAQKNLLSYPYAFSTKRTNAASFNKGAYVMADKRSANIAFVLQDIDKAAYVLVDSNFKKVADFSLPAKETIFDFDASNLNQLNYVGATYNGSNYNFVYKNSTTKAFTSKEYYNYKIETVDFTAKKVAQKDFVNVPKKEKVISGFSEYNRFFLITALDETYELKLYMLSGNGVATEKTIAFPKIETDAKKSKKLSDYFTDIVTINTGEMPALDDASKKAKLYTANNALTFVVNDNKTTQIVTINTNDYSVTSNNIMNSNPEAGESKDKSVVNSYKTENKLFTMQLVPDKIVVSVYELNGKFLNKIEITEQNINQLMTGTGEYEERRGSKIKNESLDDFAQLVKALKKGTQGITVETTAAGRYLVTIGTYDEIIVESGGGGSYHSAVGYGQATAGQQQMTSNTYSYSYYTPGVSKFVSRPNYYKSTTASFLLDAATHKPVKSKIPEPEATQIKNYVENAGGTMRSQFVFKGKQYYGSYDKEAEAYIFSQIPVKK